MYKGGAFTFMRLILAVEEQDGAKAKCVVYLETRNGRQASIIRLRIDNTGKPDRRGSSWKKYKDEAWILNYEISND